MSNPTFWDKNEEKNKKKNNITDLSSAEFVQRLQKVKICIKYAFAA